MTRSNGRFPIFFSGLAGKERADDVEFAPTDERYALARMLLEPTNFLLLDEPTNHLDMRAKDVLLESLNKYTGTVVFVSHDRYFIDHLATRIFEIEDGHVHIFPGNYEDYLWRKQGGPESVLAKGGRTPEPEPPPEILAEPKKRVNPMRLIKIRDRLREVEQQVTGLESEIQQLDATLADFKSVEETMRLSEQATTRRKELESRVAEWEALSAELEAAS